MESATLETLLPRYRSALVARGHRPRGIDRYLDQLRAFVTYLDADATMADVTTASITAYQEDFARRCSPGTVGNALTVIRSFCRWAIRVGHRTDDPTLSIQWPRRTKPSPRALKQSELQKLFVALTSYSQLSPYHEFMLRRNRRAIFLMLFAGLRISEAAALRWREVDLDDGALFVRQGKGGKDRCVPLHPHLLDELRAAPTHYRGFAVAGGKDDQPLSPKSMAHIFEIWLPKRGLRISAHQLRHTFATELLRNKADLRHIQELLGHESLETTQAYLAVDVEGLRSAVALLPSQW